MTGLERKRYSRVTHRFALCFGTLLLFVLGCTRPETESSDIELADSALESAKRVRAHMEVLAADEMRGREAGTEAYDQAAKYVADKFAELGLVPLGDNNSYFQQVDLVGSNLIKNGSSVTLYNNEQETPLSFGIDYVQFGGFSEVAEHIRAPVVFAGHGIVAPKSNHNDYAEIDSSGKIVAVFTGAPETFDRDERAYYSSGTLKSETAIRNGALGMMKIRTPADSGRLTWERMLRYSDSTAMRWIAGDGTYFEGYSGLSGNSMLSDSGARTLFELANRNLDRQFEIQSAGTVSSFDMNVVADLSRNSILSFATSHNVVALLRGSDEELRHEYILVTAHLDHLGYSVSETEEVSIYNGAYDNAAGVSVMLELAKLLSTSAKHPRRSVIFAAVTAEEKGLRGSSYLANNPPIDIHKVVANLNIDMPFLGHPIANIEGLGVEHSTLHGMLSKAADDVGLELTPDPRPELVRLIRSDQFSFVQKGVPGFNLKPGSLSNDPSIAGAELRSQFLSEHYHEVSDDLSLPYNEEGAERFVKVALNFLHRAGNADQAPAWNDGDFFGELFAPNQKANARVNGR